MNVYKTSSQNNVNTRDEVKSPVVVVFNKVTNSTTLTTTAAKGTRALVVASATGISIGSYLILFNANDGSFGFYTVTGVSGTDVTVDNELEYDFSSGTNVDVATTDLNVDGSSTSQVFGIRGDTSGSPVKVSVHLTKVVATCVATTKPDITDFGDIASLTRGLLFRFRDGSTQNLGSAKSNIELASQAGRWELLESAISGYGFIAELVFSGRENLNTVLQLNPGEDLELVVQDNLTGLSSLKAIAFGHIKPTT